ncbi:MAG: hypothetical protein KGY99_05795 [Phycisphaerae bacterium]|nr:hypothetical protein [Phycisphaerae bacterium]
MTKRLWIMLLAALMTVGLTAGAHADEHEAADGERQLTPWGKASVGDMVKYKTMGDMLQTLTVKKIGDETVHIEMVMEVNDREMPAQMMEMPRYAKPGEDETPEGVEVEELGTETVAIGDEKVTCEVRKMTMTQDGRTITSKTWTSDDVPGATVKTASDAMGEMTVMMQVVAFKKK